MSNNWDSLTDALAESIAKEMAKEIDAHFLEQIRRESLTQEERDMEDVFNKLKYAPGKRNSIYNSSMYPEFTIDKSTIDVPPRKLTARWTYESKKN